MTFSVDIAWVQNIEPLRDGQHCVGVENLQPSLKMTNNLNIYDTRQKIF